MRLELHTTKDALIYQCDDEQPVTLHGSAANKGIQLDDEHNTQVRAFSKGPYISSICVIQDGVDGRDFFTPIGMPIVLEDTTIESGVGWQVISRHWGKRLYQHKLYFESASQVMQALDALSQINITVLNVEVRPGRCRSLSFQTPYALGPVMRAVLSYGMQPGTAMFNRDPQTWEIVPWWIRVTRAQVVLIVAVFAMCCGPAWHEMFNLGNNISSLDFWNNVLLGIFLIALVAWVSPDIAGLQKNAEVTKFRRAVDRLVNRKRYADAR